MTAGAPEPLPAGAKFALGEVIISPGAARCLSAELISIVLARHQAGDWGDVSAYTAGDNEDALRRGGPVISAYMKRPPGFRIVTAADRRTTRIEMELEHLYAPRP